MAEIIWTYKAYEDYKNIIEFIAKDSEHFASLMAKKIWLEIKRIEHSPKAARMVPEAGYDPEIREFILGQYRIIFQFKEKKAFLLTIHHSSRNLKKKSLLAQVIK
ncbi:MAG: type II toxin-antitoxin system RelE/ParE family toxin [Bacteroidales bacterium]|nr:type II toxin-antitoxin system RelE/ParE family toxin [Bacteroidales bacterium]